MFCTTAAWLKAAASAKRGKKPSRAAESWLAATPTVTERRTNSKPPSVSRSATFMLISACLLSPVALTICVIALPVMSFTPVPLLSFACCSLASTVAEAPSTPVWMSAMSAKKFFASTQPVVTVLAATEAGSRVASTETASEGFWLGVIALSFLEVERGRLRGPGQRSARLQRDEGRQVVGAVRRRDRCGDLRLCVDPERRAEGCHVGVEVKVHGRRRLHAARLR